MGINQKFRNNTAYLIYRYKYFNYTSNELEKIESTKICKIVYFFFFKQCRRMATILTWFVGGLCSNLVLASYFCLNSHSFRTQFHKREEKQNIDSWIHFSCAGIFIHGTLYYSLQVRLLCLTWLVIWPEVPEWSEQMVGYHCIPSNNIEQMGLAIGWPDVWFWFR